MKKHNTKPQVNVGENKRQLLRLSSVNATCFIKYCLPCGVFFMFTSHSLLVGYSFPKRLLTIFSTPNNHFAALGWIQDFEKGGSNKWVAEDEPI